MWERGGKQLLHISNYVKNVATCCTCPHCACVCAQRQFVVKHKKTSLPAWLHCLFYSCPPLSRTLPSLSNAATPLWWRKVNCSGRVSSCFALLTHQRQFSFNHAELCVTVCACVWVYVCVWIVNLLQSGAGNYYISTLRTCTLRHATCYCEGTSTCPLPLSLLLLVYFPLPLSCCTFYPV